MVAEFDAWDAMCYDAFDVGQRGYIGLMLPYKETLKFYEDAAANTREPFVYSVGGYIGKVRDWQSFRKEWREKLAGHGFGERPFHMTDFEYAQHAAKTGERISRKSPYYGWSYDQFLPLQEKLLSIITRRKHTGFRLTGFMGAVPPPDFQKFRESIPEQIRDDQGFNNEYMWNVILNMESVAMWADENDYHDPIHYVFASGDKQGGNLEQWFDACWEVDYMRKHYRLSKDYSVMPYSIAKMKLEPAIQGADVGLYEFNKYSVEVVRAGGDQSKVKMRESLKNLAKVKLNGKLMMYNELMEALEHMMWQRKTYPVWPHVGPITPKAKKRGSR